MCLYSKEKGAKAPVVEVEMEREELDEESDAGKGVGDGGDITFFW